MDLDSKLFRRIWLIKNKEWLYNEMAYHKAIQHYLKGKRLVIWKMGDPHRTTKIEL